jgi:hypothetical protein
MCMMQGRSHQKAQRRTSLMDIVQYIIGPDGYCAIYNWGFKTKYKVASRFNCDYIAHVL